MKSNMSSKLWPDHANVISDSSVNNLYQKLNTEYEELITKEKLDLDILPQFKDIYIPIAAWLAQKHLDKPIVVGINGAQGSGKSTLSKILKMLLGNGFGKSVITLSIDDLYLSQNKRQELANEIHPLLKVRGVPGTHDVELGSKILSSVIQANPDLPVKIPEFDKSQDDLLPESEWLSINEPVDIILFEGWCVGARAQEEKELIDGINDLERSRDTNGVWRRYVNDQLAGPYQTLFGYIDYLLMLKVPDMESVFVWRNLQERKLEEDCKSKGLSTAKVMSPTEVANFIMYYERITRTCISEIPDRANILLELDKNHQINNIVVSK